MKIEQYQNIVVINITNGKYTNCWIYRADAVNPDKTHGWDSLPVYLSALKQAAVNPEVHKRSNGEDKHLYYIPMGDTIDLEKAKKIAFSKFSRWKQPWETMPEYVIRFLFKRKQTAPVKIQLFKKDRNDPAYTEAYHQSVFHPCHQKGAQQLIIYWHGSTVRQITEEVMALTAERWRNARLSSWF